MVDCRLCSLKNACGYRGQVLQAILNRASGRHWNLIAGSGDWNRWNKSVALHPKLFHMAETWGTAEHAAAWAEEYSQQDFVGAPLRLRALAKKSTTIIGTSAETVWDCH